MSRTLYLSRLRRLLSKDAVSFSDALRSRKGWRPREVEIRLTWSCNASCVMCGLDNFLDKIGHEYNKRLPVARLLNVIDEIAQLECETILFSGGEVSLVKELPDILKHVNSFGIESHINTNGSKLTPAYCDMLLESGLNGLMVSLDAAEPYLHDKIRKLPGLFDTAVNGLSYLRGKRPDKRGFYMIINTVIMKNNFRQLPEIVKVAAESGAGEINFSPLSIDNSWDDWATGVTELKLDDNDEVELAQDIFPKVMSMAKKHKINAMIPAQILPDGSIRIEKKLFNSDFVNCAVSHYHCVINVNGDVLPCCYSSPGEYTMGNVSVDSFGDVWNCEKFTQFRDNCFPAKFAMCVSCSQHRNENELIQRWFDRLLKTEATEKT